MKLMTKQNMLILLAAAMPFVQNCSSARYEQIKGAPITAQQIPPAREPMGPLDVRPVPPGTGVSTQQPPAPNLPPNASGEQPRTPIDVVVDGPAPAPVPVTVNTPGWKDPTHYKRVPAPQAEIPEPTPAPYEPPPRYEPPPQEPPPRYEPPVKDPPPRYEPPVSRPAEDCPPLDCFVGRYEQPKAMVTQKLDILFVVDTSDSIFKEREAAADGIERLMAVMPAATDYHIGVLVAHGPSTGLTGELVRAGQEPAVLKSKEMSTEQIRAALRAKLTGIKGDAEADGGELGLYSLDASLTGAKLQKNLQLGMFRRDAGLAVIFMSDENDICSLDHYPPGVTPKRDPNGKEVPAFKKHCEGNVGAGSVYRKIVRQKVDGYDSAADMNIISKPLIMAAIVYTNPSTVPNRDSSDRYAEENEVGYGYLDVVQMNNGIAVDLASGDIPAALQAIGEKTRGKLAMKTEFMIHDQNQVDPNTICVLVDGQEVEHTYDEGRKEVHISNGGRPSSVIEVLYCLDNGRPVNQAKYSGTNIDVRCQQLRKRLHK